jgi:hypothetical protein
MMKRKKKRRRDMDTRIGVIVLRFSIFQGADLWQ